MLAQDRRHLKGRRALLVQRIWDRRVKGIAATQLNTTDTDQIASLFAAAQSAEQAAVIIDQERARQTGDNSEDADNHDDDNDDDDNDDDDDGFELSEDELARVRADLAAFQRVADADADDGATDCDDPPPRTEPGSDTARAEPDSDAASATGAAGQQPVGGPAAAAKSRRGRAQVHIGGFVYN